MGPAKASRRARAVPAFIAPLLALALAACGSGAVKTSSGTSTTASGTTGTTGSGGSSTTTTSPPASSTASCISSAAPSAGSSLTGVEFVSAGAGWAVGPGRILATANGGATWQMQLSGSQHFGSVDFISASDGWVVSKTHLLVTTDGGACWKYAGEPQAPLRSVHFVSPSVGWGVSGGPVEVPTPSGPGVGSGGTLVKTTNGGASWSAVGTAPSGAQGVCFVNSTRGWLTAQDAVYSSQDGGASWQRVYAIPTRGPVATSVQCAAPSGVWVLAASGEAAAGTSPWAVFSSQDGTSFHPVVSVMFYNLKSALAPGSYPGAISAISPSEAAILGFTPAINPNPGGLSMASSSGATARTALTGPLAIPSAASFVSNSQGWVVGVGQSKASTGYIEHTADGGASWSLQYTVP